MKIQNYKKGTEFEITCVRFNHPNHGLIYNAFQIKKNFANMWGEDPNNVITVKATIVDEDVIIEDLMRDKSYDDNCVDYFGLVDFNEDGTFDIGLIYPNIKQYFVCFPSGPGATRFWNFDDKDYETGKYHHKIGDRRSMTVRLKIDEI